MFVVDKSLWYSVYRVCGGLCTRDKTHFSPVDVIKNLWGEGGLSLKDKLYIYYILLISLCDVI
jgi:hypothetical protein